MVVRVNGSTGIVTVSGTSGAPSLRGPDGNSGISFDGDQVIISSSGLVAATFSDSAATINNLSVDTTTLEFSPGSSGTPTVAPSGDLNTGIYFPAADTIGFAEGGNEAARIDSSGRLLVGTSSAPSNKNSVTPSLVINGNGVNGAAQIVRHTSVGGGGALLELSATRGTSATDYTILQSGDGIGTVDFLGADGDEYVVAANILAQVDGTPGANDMPGRLVFSTTADGASSPTERMRITSTGDLQFNSGYGSVATAYGCRAWVNFNGTGTVAIRQSGNVSSITDNTTGDYTVNFTTAMPDANYSVLWSVGPDVTSGSPEVMIPRMTNFDSTTNTYQAQTTTTVRVCSSNLAGTLYDTAVGTIAIFR